MTLPQIAPVVWTIICVLALFFIVRWIVRYTKRRNNSTPTLLVALLMLTGLFSCQKETEQPPDIISELGFDKSKVKIGNTSATTAKSFASIEEAKKYFIGCKPGTVTVAGNTITNTLATDIDLEVVGGFPEPIFDEYYDVFDNNGKYGVRVRSGMLFSGHQVVFTYERSGNGPPTNVGEFNSSLYGLTLGVSWDHLGGSGWVSGNTIHFTVWGVQNYNVLLEGIGTLFQMPTTISGTYNVQTKHLTITTMWD